MDDAAAASGGEVHGDTAMARRGGEEKPTKVARAIAGMAGGEGEFSYTRNSSVQSQSVNILKPILEQEIQELELFKNDWSGSAIRMADFGCSVGANTLGYAEICYRTVCRARLSSNGPKIPDEVQYFFCDLPSNDFNTLFLQVEDWKKAQPSTEDFYATAVAGSFYRRLFPRGSLHVAISTLALNWMSQVPNALLDKSSTAYNKGTVWTSDKNVAALEAFTQTARQDLHNFLLSRADEVVPGGLVLIFCRGRVEEHHPQIQWPREGVNWSPYNKPFEETWEELVTEGIIEEERRDTFNVPVYCYSMDDVKEVIESTNAFHIKRCEFKQQSYFPPNDPEPILANPKAYGWFIKNFVRSIMNAIMVEHIGEEKCEVFFERLERNAAKGAQEKRVSNLPMECIVAVLIRK